MNTIPLENKLKHVNIIELEHLMLEIEKGEHIVTLVDANGYKIIRGYGKCTIEALNDMHHNLI